METNPVVFRLEFKRSQALYPLVFLFVCLTTSTLSPESVTLSTYYPSPAGVYNNLVSIGDTWLARDPLSGGGASFVEIGSNQATSGVKVNIFAQDDPAFDSIRIHGSNAASNEYGIINVSDSGQYERLGYFNGSGMGTVFLDGNTGVGTMTPEQELSVQNSMNVDQANSNNGSSPNPGITFGGGSGEGISSNRTGGSYDTQYGLDFYAGSTKEMSLTHRGTPLAYNQPFTTFDGGQSCQESTVYQVCPDSTGQVVCPPGYYATMTEGIYSHMVASPGSDYLTTGVCLKWCPGACQRWCTTRTCLRTCNFRGRRYCCRYGRWTRTCCGYGPNTCCGGYATINPDQTGVSNSWCQANSASAKALCCPCPDGLQCWL